MASSTRRVPASIWEECWERVLCLPIDEVSDDDLYSSAKRLVETYRRLTEECGMDWFAAQVEDGLAFVHEQLLVDPRDGDWQRIASSLTGAQAAMSGSLREDHLDDGE